MSKWVPFRAGAITTLRQCSRYIYEDFAEYSLAPYPTMAYPPAHVAKNAVVYRMEGYRRYCPVWDIC